jgi:hypothetical protein
LIDRRRDGPGAPEAIGKNQVGREELLPAVRVLACPAIHLREIFERARGIVDRGLRE